jgi:hypothetical protein
MLMASNLWPTLKQLIHSVKGNPQLKVEKITTPQPINKRQKARFSDSQTEGVLKFHQEMNGFTMLWSAKTNKDPDVKGSIKILSAEEIFQDWQRVVFFDFTPENAAIRNFYPVDFFVDECCVGIYWQDSAAVSTAPLLHLYRFEGEPQNLYLTVEGYAHMMAAARGFLYWQKSILEIISGQENPDSKRFKAAMPQLFEDFSWDEYVALYQQTKVSA